MPRASQVVKAHRDFTLFSRFPLYGWLLLLGIFYSVLFQRYRAYEIDNPWYLSFSRNFWVHRFREDYFLNGVFPDGMGGTEVFGRLPALIQGAFLNSMHWMPIPAMLLSTAVVLAGLWMWYLFLYSSGFSKEQSIANVLALGVTEPFVGMADRFRYEPYAFLLLATTFWLVSKGRSQLALIMGLLALEIEPAAGMVFLSVCLLLVRSGMSWKGFFAALGIAVLCFWAIYWILHPHFFAILRATDWHRGAAQREVGGFLQAYFVDRKRHLLELALLTGCAVFYARHFRQAPSMVKRMAEVVCLLSLCSFAMRWPTPAYMVFWYPAALVVVGWCLPTVGWPVWGLPLLMAGFMLPQYAALVWINREEGYRPADLKAVHASILLAEQRAGLDDQTTQIMGDYSLWFAHPEHYRGLARTTMRFIDQENLFLCFEQPLRQPEMVDPLVRYCDDVRQNVRVRDLGVLEVRGHLLHIFAAEPFKKRNNSAPPQPAAVTNSR